MYVSHSTRLYINIMLTNCRPLYITGMLEITFEVSVGKFITPQNDTKTVKNELPLVKLLFFLHSDKFKIYN